MSPPPAGEAAAPSLPSPRKTPLWQRLLPWLVGSARYWPGRSTENSLSWYERAAIAIAGTGPGAWFFINVAMRLDRVLVPLTRGRLSSCLGTRYHGRHLLLLTTIGAKSGRRRTVPLLYFLDGDAIVLMRTVSHARTELGGSAGRDVNPRS